MSGNDYVQRRIGEIGRWQWRILIIMGFAAALGAWQTLSISFMLPEPKFRCLPEEIELQSDEQSFDPRLRWNRTRDITKDYIVSEDQCSYTSKSGSENKTCTKWVYETNGHLVQDFNLVCDNDKLISISKAIYMCGMMFGTLTSGVLSDLFGRKKVMLGLAVIFSVISCCCAASSSMQVFIALRFFVAMSGIAMYTTCYVYAMEIIGGYWNTVIGIGFQIPWAIAYIILPGLAYAMPYWVHLQLAVSLPCLLFVLILLIPGLVPESPKWLLAKGFEKEAEEILDAAAKMNNISTKITTTLQDKVGEAPPKRNWSYLDIFKSPHTIVCTLVMFYLWFTNSLVYYGFVLNAGTLMPGDIYVNNLISGILELVAYILTIVVFFFGGRRYPQCVTMVFAGVALLLTLISRPPDKNAENEEESDETVKLVFGQLGKFAITASFAMVYLYAAELFPTVIRNSGMANSSFFARVGAVSAPFAGRELAKIDPRIPIVLFAILAILAGLLTLVLPETKDNVLPETIKDGEKFIANKDATFRQCLPKPAN